MSAHDPHLILRHDEEDAETIDGDALSKADSAETQSLSLNHGFKYSADSSLYDVAHPPYLSPSPWEQYPGAAMFPFQSPAEYSNYPPPQATYGGYAPMQSYHYPHTACNCEQCAPHLPPPAPVSKPNPTVMCCYHKRGVCKKGADCWYSHEGSPDTPCHYGVKCVAGHGILSRTALGAHTHLPKGNGNGYIPVWARHPFKNTKEPMKGPRPPMSRPPPPPPSYPTPERVTEESPPMAPTEKIVAPPSLDDVTCKFCGHDKLYVMPYRSYSSNTHSTLQYRVHCMSCHGSWTPSTPPSGPTLPTNPMPMTPT
jgi:hypothetical protein